MTTLSDIPDAATLLAMEPEELAPIVLRTAVANQLLFQALFNQIFDYQNPTTETRFPRPMRDDIELSVGEAWQWLLVNGMLIPQPGPNGPTGRMKLTRRGKKVLARPDGFDQFKQSVAISKSMFHVAIADSVWLDLIRGDLDSAVFRAFKAVEVAVREAGGFQATDIGVKLMRDAFDKDSGPLTKPSDPESERIALAHLFAGAIGSYKNPHSHRTVSIADVREAQEMVLLASHLLRIVDSRQR